MGEMFCNSFRMFLKKSLIQMKLPTNKNLLLEGDTAAEIFS